MMASADNGNTGGDSLRVSVVIPTCGRPQLLARCLEALAAQTLRRDLFEVIVVDDSGAAQSRAFAGPVELTNARWLATTGRCGPAVARNIGWRAARAPVIAFTDDDTIPAPGWLEAGLAAIQFPVVALWGRIIVPTPDVPTDYERNTKNLEIAEFATANAFATKSVLEQVGGFDERFKRAWREDADLFFSLLEHRGKVVHAPRAIVIHPVRPARRGECLRQHRHQLFDALLYKKHPSLYRTRIARAPLGYYLTVVGSLAAAALLAARLPSAALLVAMAAMIPVAALARKRLAGTSRAFTDRLEVVATSVAIPFVAVYWRLRGAWRFQVLFL